MLKTNQLLPFVRASRQLGLCATHPGQLYGAAHGPEEGLTHVTFFGEGPPIFRRSRLEMSTKWGQRHNDAGMELGNTFKSILIVFSEHFQLH